MAARVEVTVTAGTFGYVLGDLSSELGVESRSFTVADGESLTLTRGSADSACTVGRTFGQPVRVAGNKRTAINQPYSMPKSAAKLVIEEKG